MNEIINGQIGQVYINQLVVFEQRIAELKKAHEELKSRIQKAMEQEGIKKFSNDQITINYIEPTDVETFDKTAFRKENPDLYDQYVKLGRREGYIKIAVKNNG